MQLFSADATIFFFKKFIIFLPLKTGKKTALKRVEGQFNPGLFNPRLFIHELFNPKVQKFMVEKSGVEKFMVEKSGVELSFNLLER